MKYINKKWNSTAAEQISNIADDGEPITAINLLGCYTAESIDPEVLKELVDAIFGEYADKGSQNYDTIVIEDQLELGTDSVVWRG